MTSISTEEYKVRNGESFVINISENLAAGASTNIHLENPPGDNEEAVITAIKVSSPDGKVAIDVPYGFTIDSTGTEVTVENRARGSDNVTSMDVYQGSTYSGETHTYTSYAGTGTGGAGTVVGAISDDIANTVLSDENFVLSVENTSESNARDVSVTITYYESVAQ